MFKRLKHIFSELPEADQKSLVDFGEKRVFAQSN